MKRKVALVLAPLAIIAVALVFWYRQNAPNAGPDTLGVSGNVEATTVDVSFRIPGWVRERPVDEGYAVKAGDVIARLDDTELAQMVAEAEAQVAQAQAALAALEAGSRPQEIAQAEAAADKARALLAQLLTGSRPEEKAAAAANLASAEADAERARLDYDRQKALYAQATISPQQIQAAEASYKVAEARAKAAGENARLVDIGPRKEEIDQARAALAQAEGQASLVSEGPRKEDIDQARARLAGAQQALLVARTRLSYATLPAPTSGVVLSKNVEPGEYVVPGTPVVTIGDLENVWLRAYVSETSLGRVKVGQLARVQTDTYPGKTYQGRVGFISSEAEFTPKNVETRKERVKLVYRIKIDIPNPGMELKPGMPADADIDLAPAG